jgi:hypothetical protein
MEPAVDVRWQVLVRLRWTRLDEFESGTVD